MPRHKILIVEAESELRPEMLEDMVNRVVERRAIECALGKLPRVGRSAQWFEREYARAARRNENHVNQQEELP